MKEPISHTVEETADLKTAVSTEDETKDKRRKNDKNWVKWCSRVEERS